MYSVLVTAYMRPVQDQTRQKSQSGKGSDHTFLLLAEEMLVIYGFWESKSQFSSSFFFCGPLVTHDLVDGPIPMHIKSALSGPSGLKKKNT